MRRAVTTILAVILSAVSLLICACAHTGQTTFGIYLAQTGELILSDAHVAAYDAAEHHLELNAKGIDKWNSYRTYSGTGVPLLNEKLYHKEFIIKVDNQDICRGTFSTSFSSMLFQGVTIMDMVGSPGSKFKQLWIDSGYPDGYEGVRYDDVFDKLEDTFSNLGLRGS
jgi:hypothetical protein